jgi:DNA-binding FrmR family transcriptional regulator
VTDSTGTPATEHVVEDAKAVQAVVNRLKRAQGQLGGAIAMLEDGRSCQDVVTLLAAASKAVDRAAFQMISTSLRECVVAGDQDADAVAEQLQKLFLSLA